MDARARIAVALVSLWVAACGGDGNGGGGSSDDERDTGYTLAGTVTVAPNASIDSDTNEVSAPQTANDSFDDAQPIRNPVTHGGFANVAGAGAPGGHSTASGDMRDKYRVALEADQEITLEIASADPEANDLDLYAYPARCADGGCGVPENASGGCFNPDEPAAIGAEAQSQSTGPTESISGLDSGEYFIEVCAYRGASNYVLTVGQSAPGAADAALDRPFVPGDVIVRFKDDDRVTTAQSYSAGDSARARAVELGMEFKGGGRGRPALLGIGRDRANRHGALGRPARDGKRAAAAARGKEALLKWDTRAAVRSLRKRADVAYAEPNYLVDSLRAPDDEHYPSQWHYPQIHLPQAWDITTGNNGDGTQDNDPIVAVIDTGIRADHSDFGGQLVSGYDFISDADNAADGDGLDADPHDPGDGAHGEPSSFHGTHVAGTVAASSNDGNGTAGAAWHANIMPLRTLGLDGGSTYDLAQAIYYAAGRANDSNERPRRAADVINMSLGGPGTSQVLQEAIAAAREEGLLLVAASGNESTDTPLYPAAYEGVLSVSAVGPDQKLAPYSNFGPTIDIAAPGGDMAVDRNNDNHPDGVLSTSWDEDSNAEAWAFHQGTSMAAPHVAGVLALMRALNPTLTPQQIDALLASGDMTDDIGVDGPDESYGHGLINALKAVSAASTGTIPAHILVSEPVALHYGATRTDAALEISNGGDGALTGVSVTASEPWLSVTADSVDAEGVGMYGVSVDRSGLDDGTYNAQVEVDSNETDRLSVPVTLQVGGPIEPADAGRHFFLLIDAATDEAVAEVAANAQDGAYAFEFTGIPPGEYRILAGTDSDYDGLICDAGEACGAYPSAQNIATLTVDEDRANLDFITDFQTGMDAHGAEDAIDPARRPSSRSDSAPITSQDDLERIH